MHRVREQWFNNLPQHTTLSRVIYELWFLELFNEAASTQEVRPTKRRMRVHINTE